MFEVITLANTLPSRVKAMMSVAADPTVSSAATIVRAHAPGARWPVLMRPCSYASAHAAVGTRTARAQAGASGARSPSRAMSTRVPLGGWAGQGV